MSSSVVELLAAQQAALLRLQSGSLFGALPFSHRVALPTSEIHTLPETPSTSSAESSSTTSPTSTSSSSTAIVPLPATSLPSVSTAVSAASTTQSAVAAAASNLRSMIPTVPTPPNPAGIGLQNIKDLLLLQQQQLQQAQLQQQIAQQQAQQLATHATTLTPESSPRAGGYPINPLILRGAYPANGESFIIILMNRANPSSKKSRFAQISNNFISGLISLIFSWVRFRLMVIDSLLLP